MMKTLLRIDSSLRYTDSISRALGDHFVSCWLEKYPAGKIVTRDLQSSPVPHLMPSTVNAFFGGQDGKQELALSDALIDEIIHSDELVITCPMYNFQIPSSLKAYFDHVVRINKTFRLREGVYEGLVSNKKCQVLTAMGGRKTSGEEPFEAYLRNILKFMGIHDTTIYCVDGTATPAYATIAMEETKRKITNQFKHDHARASKESGY